MGVTATLLLSCPDAKGVVAGVSDLIFRNGGNIIHADQHTDREQGVFLQRVEWELDGFAVPRHEIARAFQPLADRFRMTWELHFSDAVPRLAILVSKQPHCMVDLLVRRSMGDFVAEVPLIVSNHPDHEATARSWGARYVCLPDPSSDRILAELEAERIDVVVLARYMRILHGAILGRFEHRIINIHHSFLPAFVGARPYHQAHARGVKVVGATAHYVTAELDQGPIIEQDVVRVSHRDTVPELVRKGRDLEKRVLGSAVTMHLRNRVLVYGSKTVVFD
jgi:formyltetrahydrofolate deformylase